MAYKQVYLWILPVLWGAAWGQLDPTQRANMEGEACDRIGDFSIDDSDIFQVYAKFPQLPGWSSTRDKCIIGVSAPANRRLKLYILEAYFGDCGTQVEIFDGSSHMITPRLTLSCSSKHKTYDTRTETVRIRLTKQSTAANLYRLSIAITTDQGPDINFEKAMASYNANALGIGAIVGICIAAGLLLVALIAIFIYCVVKQRHKNMETYKEDPPVYSSAASKVVFPHKDRRAGSQDSRDTSSHDSHNSSISSGDGQVFVSMEPDPKGKPRRSEKGYSNKAYVPSEDGGHDRSRDSTGSEDTAGGHVNASFESNETPRRRFNKHQENGTANGSISRGGSRGSAKRKSDRKRSTSSDDKRLRPSRDGRDGSRHRARSNSGSRSGHRDSARRRSRSHGENSGSQRRSRSRSPHSQSSRDSYFDKDGLNRSYNISSISHRHRDQSNSSTSSRDSGDERKVSYDPNPSRSRRREPDYGSQV